MLDGTGRILGGHRAGPESARLSYSVKDADPPWRIQFGRGRALLDHATLDAGHVARRQLSRPFSFLFTVE